MRSFNRAFCLLTLLGWLFATGHVALEHGGVVDGGAHHALAGGADDDDHDDDAPAPGGEHHHHDLSVMDRGQSMKAVELEAIMPVWVPLFDVLAEHIASVRRQRLDMRVPLTFEHAPPDERASGWLLVCRTALPVRGPSLGV